MKENKDKTASKIKSKAMDVELSDKSKQLQALDKENSNVKVEIKTFQKCVKDYRKEILN